jgi:hypothetical protein
MKITREHLDIFAAFVKDKLQKHYSQQDAPVKKLKVVEPGKLDEIPFPVEFTEEEKAVILLALVPHCDPNFFNVIISDLLPQGGDFAEFGGIRGTNHRGIIPTGETAQYILAGNNLEKRLAIKKLFDETHYFYRNDLLWLDAVREGEPAMSGRIVLAPEWVEQLLGGSAAKPKFSADFPAALCETKMDWNDLVLHPYTHEQISDIKRWISHADVLVADKNLGRKMNKGYRVLFYGPSGTGKTLTASLLGKEFEKDVYRIDLSQIVSKYIGETEKNLSKIFDRAEHKDWILFFDEADALFGKRTSVQSSHDRYANQEVSFLLQRIEAFEGLLILATNFKTNIDDAFLRRFHSIIHFPIPNEEERLKLWKKSMPSMLKPEKDMDLEKISAEFEITGAGIINVMRYATLKAVSSNDKFLRQQDIVEGIRREFKKEEKAF